MIHLLAALAAIGECTETEADAAWELIKHHRLEDTRTPSLRLADARNAIQQVRQAAATVNHNGLLETLLDDTLAPQAAVLLAPTSSLALARFNDLARFADQIPGIGVRFTIGREELHFANGSRLRPKSTQDLAGVEQWLRARLNTLIITHIDDPTPPFPTPPNARRLILDPDQQLSRLKGATR